MERNDCMFTDYHCHILPGIDDGAKTIQESLLLLEMEHKQNVKRIVFTPHYYSMDQSIENFLHKRNESYESLLKHISPELGINFSLGAEVYLDKRLSQKENLKLLCFENTEYMLIEMPYKELESWMLDEIEEIIYNHDVTPIFAHIDRYFNIYRKKELLAILNFEKAIFQINNSSFADNKKIKMLNKYFPYKKCILGTDTHNSTTRIPNFNLITESYLKNLKLCDLDM